MTNSGPPRLALVAGEASGDLLAGLLLGGLKARWPQLHAAGIGGPNMAAQGFEAWWPHDKLAVRGYVEVLRHYREISGIREKLAERLRREPPDAFIGVDAPDFNLGLETRLKTLGIRSIHFVSPSIWAWRGSRIDKIRAAVDHVLCIFPFEPAIYERHGIAATYVGHPLADAIPIEVPRAAARSALGIGSDETVVALLPGSRRSEVRYLASRFFQAAALMHRLQPDIRFIAPVIPGLRAEIEEALKASGMAGKVRLLEGQSHAALAACDATLIASGTATLEAALFKRPMVIAYNMNALSWRLMQRKQLQPWVGLPNILSREFVVPELLQDAATPQALAQATLAWLDAPEKTQALQQKFSELHVQLQRDTPTLCADAIQKVLEG